VTTSALLAPICYSPRFELRHFHRNFNRLPVRFTFSRVNLADATGHPSQHRSPLSFSPPMLLTFPLLRSLHPPPLFPLSTFFYFLTPYDPPSPPTPRSLSLIPFSIFPFHIFITHCSFRLLLPPQPLSPQCPTLLLNLLSHFPDSVLPAYLPCPLSPIHFHLFPHLYAYICPLRYCPRPPFNLAFILPLSSPPPFHAPLPLNSPSSPPLSFPHQYALSLPSSPYFSPFAHIGLVSCSH